MDYEKSTNSFEIKKYIGNFPEPEGYAQYRHFTLKLLNNFSGERFNGKIKEKRSGKRNHDTVATVLFLFHSVMSVPKKLDQTILFLSISHLWLSRRYPVGN